MKLRNGFVSNSSSSSFILTKKDLKKIEHLTIDYYSVKEMMEELEKHFYPEDFHTKFPHFIAEYLSDAAREKYEDLAEVVEVYGEDCYITSSYDRDYSDIVSLDFPVYMSDL